MISMELAKKGFIGSVSDDFTLKIAFVQNLILLIIDVSGIIEKFNVYVTLAIVPRTKNINGAF